MRYLLPVTRHFLATTPFFAHLLARLPKVTDRTILVPCALAWRDVPYLRVHPERARNWVQRPAQAAEELREQLLHLLLRHPARQREFPVAWAFHLAADLEVGRYLPDSETGRAYRGLRARLRLAEQADLAAAYHALLRLRATLPRAAPLPAWTRDPLTRAHHRYWPDRLTDVQWQDWWRAQRPALEPHLVGREAAALKNLLEPPRPPSLPWPTVLRSFLQSVARTTKRDSLRRPSRRYGTFPGTRRENVTRLAVVIDTSGSIDADRRAEFWRELQALHALTHELTILEADYRVRAVYPFTGTPPPESRGGGRTNFDPALIYLNETPHPYDGVVYLTDGQAAPPTTVVTYPLLWIIRARELPDVEGWPGRVVWWR